MWIMTKHGFFSVVEFRGEPENLLVRARDRAHLESLQRSYPVLYDIGCGQIENTPEADYPFRMKVQREDFLEVVCGITNDIDYPNFKAAIPHTEGRFLRFLHDVWALGRRMQERE